MSKEIPNEVKRLYEIIGTDEQFQSEMDCYMKLAERREPEIEEHREWLANAQSDAEREVAQQLLNGIFDELAEAFRCPLSRKRAAMRLESDELLPPTVLKKIRELQDTEKVYQDQIKTLEQEQSRFWDVIRINPTATTLPDRASEEAKFDHSKIVRLKYNVQHRLFCIQVQIRELRNHWFETERRQQLKEMEVLS